VVSQVGLAMGIRLAHQRVQKAGKCQRILPLLAAVA
jgi:hypothetical protein